MTDPTMSMSESPFQLPNNPAVSDVSEKSSKSLLKIAELFEESIVLQDRVYRSKTFQSTFLGTEAVTVLVSILRDTFSREVPREYAEILAQTLQERFRLYSHVAANERLIVDDYYIFRFNNKESRLVPPTTTVTTMEDDEYFHKLFNGEMTSKDDGDEGFFDDDAEIGMMMERMGAKEWLPDDNTGNDLTGIALLNADPKRTADSFEKAVTVKNNHYHGKEFKNSFVGSDAVDAMLACALAKTRQEAELLGQELESKHNLFRHCTGQHRFEDNHYFYEFTSEDERKGLGAVVAAAAAATEEAPNKKQDLSKIAQDFKDHVSVKDIRHRLKTYRQSFVGSQAVSYLVDSGYASNRIEGVELGKRLATEYNLFGETGAEQYDFRDDFIFYSFNDDDEFDEDDLDESKGTDKNNVQKVTQVPPPIQGPNIEILIQEDTNRKTSNMDVVAEHLAWKVSLKKFEDKDAERWRRLPRKKRWFLVFRSLDPRWRILDHFRGVDQRKKIHPLIRIWYPPRSENVFSVWRVTKEDAIKKMIEGRAVGKGLDIKGKSAKRGKLSGYVPFLQIGDNRHKEYIDTLGKNAMVRIFFPYAIDKVVEKLKMQAKVMVESVETARYLLANQDGASLEDLKDAQKTLEEWDMGNPNITILSSYEPDCFGVEISMRLFWQTFIVQQDITRTPGSHYDTGRPSIPANQNLNIAAICDKPKVGTSRTVIWQNAGSTDPFNPQELLMAYEEHGRVLPVASDFDAFLIGTRRMNFDHPLPPDQVKMLKWSIEQIEKILDAPPRPGSWDKRWFENLEREKLRGAEKKTCPRFGYGDPTSYSLVENAVGALSRDGSVRHGPESFNYYTPQSMESEFLVVSDSLGKRPWKKFKEAELREFLSGKIDDGFSFPLHPKWILCDPGWKKLYDKLLASKTKEVINSMNVWFPPESGVREKIDEIASKHPGGFEGGEIRSQEEVKNKFGTILKQKGLVHRKIAPAYVRRGIKGEKIVTTVQGVLETENTVRDDTSWVVRSRAGECYVITDEDFESSYDKDTLREIDRESLPPTIFERLEKQCFQEVRSKRKVYAHRVDSSDMDWFRYYKVIESQNDKAAHFVAPWREYVRVEEGDVLVMQYPGGNDDVYRIEYSSFSETYEPIDEQHRIAEKKLLPENSQLTDDDVKSSRHSSGLDGRTLRSQDETQDRFVPLLKNSRVYRKNLSSYIRKGRKGETIVTVIDGKLETEKTVEDDSSWVVRGKAADEYYVVANKDFEKQYDRDSADDTSIPTKLVQEGFKEYQSKSVMFAREVDEDDIKWFHFGTEPAEEKHVAYFMAPWGEYMRVEKGDMLLTRYPDGDGGVYRVERLVFDASYKLDTKH